MVGIENQYLDRYLFVQKKIFFVLYSNVHWHFSNKNYFKKYISSNHNRMDNSIKKKNINSEDDGWKLNEKLFCFF